jgi:hypothetical protein
MEAQNRMENTRTWGGNEKLFNGIALPVWEDGKFWKWLVMVLCGIVDPLNTNELYIFRCLK